MVRVLEDVQREREILSAQDVVVAVCVRQHCLRRFHSQGSEEVPATGQTTRAPARAKEDLFRCGDNATTLLRGCF